MVGVGVVREVGVKRSTGVGEVETLVDWEAGRPVVEAPALAEAPAIMLAVEVTEGVREEVSVTDAVEVPELPSCREAEREGEEDTLRVTDEEPEGEAAAEGEAASVLESVGVTLLHCVMVGV